MFEPRQILLRSTSNYDGTSTIMLARDRDLVAANGLVYIANVTGPAGIIPADFWGIFSAERPKLVGVAFSSSNPRSVARVISVAGRVRDEINLRPDFQYVTMHGQDQLSVSTAEGSPAAGTSNELHLEVNEVSEADHTAWALAHPPTRIHTRFKLTRQAPFGEDATAPPFAPAFFWDPAARMFRSTDATDGPIPIAALSPFSHGFGALVSIRYSNSNNDGRVITVEGTTRSRYILQSAIPNGRWSRVFYASHDDMICLAATPFAGNPTIVCDIETVAVEPADRLRGRYEHPELLPDPLGHNL
jgi:hypothetical protein